MVKRVILFDVDGTLIDSNDAHVDAWQQAFAQDGHRFTRAEIHAQVGKGGDNLVPSLLPGTAAGIQKRIDQAHGDIYKRDFLPHVAPFARAKSVLKKLAARGHTLVLASSASREEVDRYILLLDAEGLLSGTMSSDDVENSKPCPDIFAAALAGTGYPAQSAIVIGDTPYDIIAARRAGLDAIAMLSGGFAEADLRSCEPVAIYRDVAELDVNYENSILCRLDA